jgi:hypothetical protein
MDLISINDINLYYRISHVIASTSGKNYVFILTSDIGYLPDIKADVCISRISADYTLIVFVDTIEDKKDTRIMLPMSTQGHVEGECVKILHKVFEVEPRYKGAEPPKRKPFHPQL